jgi:hypothetical protein
MSPQKQRHQGALLPMSSLPSLSSARPTRITVKAETQPLLNSSTDYLVAPANEWEASASTNMHTPPHRTPQATLPLEVAEATPKPRGGRRKSSQEQTPHGKDGGTAAVPSPEASLISRFSIGQFLYAKDEKGLWAEAFVIELSPTAVKVHFKGFGKWVCVASVSCCQCAQAI